MNDRIDLSRYFSLIKEDRINGERIERLRKQVVSETYPKSIAIELGEFRCTHRCRMCPQHSVPQEGGDRFITRKTFERILDRIDGNKIDTLEISAYGETLLHPEAVELAAMAKKRMPHVPLVFATNGLLMDKGVSRQMLDAGIDHIQVSLNTGSSASYKWFCGRGDYDRVTENLEHLVRLKKRVGSKSRITTHIMEVHELKHEFESFIRKWDGLVDQVYIRGYGNWGGMVDRNGLTGMHPLPEKRYPCSSLFSCLEILSDGRCYKCYLHGAPGADKSGMIGNIFKSDIEAIWQGNTMTRYRESHRSGDYENVPFCKACIGWSLVPNVWRENPLPGSNRWI